MKCCGLGGNTSCYGRAICADPLLVTNINYKLNPTYKNDGDVDGSNNDEEEILTMMTATDNFSSK